MIYPQTKAEELFNEGLATNLEQIAKNGCLAMSYIYCAGIDPKNELEYIRLVNKYMKKGYLDKDCSVKDAEKLLMDLTGRKTTVVKKSLTSISEIKEPTPVRYRYENREGHWVVVENGKIIFNSVLNSINVSKGQPVEARVIKWGMKK